MSDDIESLRRWLREQDDEIKRLRRMNADLLTAKHVEIVPPPIPEGFVIQELQKANVALHADIARLRSGARCPHCDELRLDLGDARREIERLRTDHALLSDDYKQLLGDVERLREENSTFSDSLAAKADRIDRLGETVARQVDEIARLRGLLEDACRWHEKFPIQRVSEALGE